MYWVMENKFSPEDELTPQGEFHHFQLVNAEGEIPVSISVLVHYNQKAARQKNQLDPINADDIIDFHDALQEFDGDFIKAFSHK